MRQMLNQNIWTRRNVFFLEQLDRSCYNTLITSTAILTKSSYKKTSLQNDVSKYN